MNVEDLAALEQASSKCHTEIPPEVREQLLRHAGNTNMAHHISQTNPIAAFSTDLAAIADWRGKLAFAKCHAIASEQHLRGKYPDWAEWPLALLHLRRMAEAGLRWCRLRVG